MEAAYTPKSVGFSDNLNVDQLQRNFTFGDTPPPSPISALKRRSIAESIHSHPTNNRPSITSPYWKGKRSSSVAMAALSNAVPYTATIRNLGELKTQEVTAASIAAFYDDVAGALLHDDEVTGLPIEYPNQVFHVMKAAAGLDHVIQPDLASLKNTEILASKNQADNLHSTTSHPFSQCEQVLSLSSPASSALNTETKVTTPLQTSVPVLNYFEQLQVQRLKQQKLDAEERQKTLLKMNQTTSKVDADGQLTEGQIYRLETDEERIARMSKRDKSELKRKIEAGKRVLDPKAIFTNIDKSHPVLSKIQPLDDALTNFPNYVVAAQKNHYEEQLHLVDSVLGQVLGDEVDAVVSEMMKERDAMQRLKYSVLKRREIEEAAKHYITNARTAASFSLHVNDRSFGSFSSFNKNSSFNQQHRPSYSRAKSEEKLSAFQLISQKPTSQRARTSLFADHNRDLSIRKRLDIDDNTGRAHFINVPDTESATDDDVVAEIETERYLTDPTTSAIFLDVKKQADDQGLIPPAEIERRQRKVRHWKRRLARDDQLTLQYFSTESERKRREHLSILLAKQVKEHVTKELVTGNCDGLFQVEQSQQDMERLRKMIKMRDELACAHRTELLKEICQVQESLRSTVGKYTELREAHEELSLRFQQAKRLVQSMGSAVPGGMNGNGTLEPSTHGWSNLPASPTINGFQQSNSVMVDARGSFMATANRPSFYDLQQVFSTGGGGLTRKRSVFNFNVSQTESKSQIGAASASRPSSGGANGKRLAMNKAQKVSPNAKIDALSDSVKTGRASRTRSQSPANLEIEALTTVASATTPYYTGHDEPVTAINATTTEITSHSISVAPTPTSEALSTSPSATNASVANNLGSNPISTNVLMPASPRTSMISGGGILSSAATTVQKPYPQPAPQSPIFAVSQQVGGTLTGNASSAANHIPSTNQSYISQFEPHSINSLKITAESGMHSVPIIVLPTLMSTDQHQDRLEKEWDAIDAKYEEAQKVIKQAQEAQRKARLMKSEASRFQAVQSKRSKEAHEDELKSLESRMQEQIDKWQKRVKVVRGKASQQIERLRTENQRESQKTTQLAKERASRSLNEWTRKLECKEMELCDQQRHFEVILENLTRKEGLIIKRFEDQIKELQEGHRVVRESDNKIIISLQAKLKEYIERERESQEANNISDKNHPLIPTPPTLSTINLNEIAEVQITKTVLKRTNSTMKKSSIDGPLPRSTTLERKASSVSSARSSIRSSPKNYEENGAGTSTPRKNPQQAKPKRSVTSVTSSRNLSTLKTSGMVDEQNDQNSKDGGFISADDFGFQPEGTVRASTRSPIGSVEGVKKENPLSTVNDPLIHPSAYDTTERNEMATQTEPLVPMIETPLLHSHTLNDAESAEEGSKKDHTAPKYANIDNSSLKTIEINNAAVGETITNEMLIGVSQTYEQKVSLLHAELMQLRDSILRELTEGIDEGIRHANELKNEEIMKQSRSQNTPPKTRNESTLHRKSPSPTPPKTASQQSPNIASADPTVGRAPHLRTADRAWQRDHQHHLDRNNHDQNQNGYQSTQTHGPHRSEEGQNSGHLMSRQQRQREEYIMEERLRWEKVCRIAINEVGTPPPNPGGNILAPRRPQSASIGKRHTRPM